MLKWWEWRRRCWAKLFFRSRRENIVDDGTAGRPLNLLSSRKIHVRLRTCSAPNKLAHERYFVRFDCRQKAYTAWKIDGFPVRVCVLWRNKKKSQSSSSSSSRHSKLCKCQPDPMLDFSFLFFILISSWCWEGGPMMMTTTTMMVVVWLLLCIDRAGIISGIFSSFISSEFCRWGGEMEGTGERMSEGSFFFLTLQWGWWDARGCGNREFLCRFFKYLLVHRRRTMSPS